MSLIAALNNAMSGLRVAQHALDVTANNVANVNTEGYTRKIVQQEAVILEGRGAGARAVDPTRAVDDFLSARVLEQQARLGRTETLSSFHEQVQERLFGAPGDGDRGIGLRISRLAAAAEGLAAGPDKPALASGFIGAAQDLAREISTAGAEVQILRREADQAVGQEVAAINRDLLALHDLNLEVLRVGARPELLDRRDTLLRGLAGRLDVSIAREDRGTISLYTRAGQPLLEATPRQLTYQPAAIVDADVSFGAIRLYRAEEIDPGTGVPVAGATGSVLVTGGIRAALTPELAADAVPDAEQRIVSPLRGGRLQGLLEARDGLLPELADQLGELAGLLRHSLNAAHNDAVAQPPPDRLVGTRRDPGAFAAAARSGTAYISVLDSTSGSAAVTIALDVSLAADPAAVAAQLSAGLTGYGTAILNADGALEITVGAGYGLAVAEGDSAIVDTDVAGRTRRFGFSHYFGLNDLLVASGPRPSDLRVRSDLVGDSSRLARTKLDVFPGPPAAATLGGVGDSRGARSLAAAFETEIAVAARGGLPGGSFRSADYLAELVAAASTKASAAESRAAGDRALAEDLAAREASISGVNLDEELSRLVLFQQAYGVSARIISITDELFDALLAIGR